MNRAVLTPNLTALGDVRDELEAGWCPGGADEPCGCGLPGGQRRRQRGARGRWIGRRPRADGSRGARAHRLAGTPKNGRKVPILSKLTPDRKKNDVVPLF